MAVIRGLSTPLLAFAVVCCMAANSGCSGDAGGNGPSSRGPMGPTFNDVSVCVPLKAPGDAVSQSSGLYLQNQGNDVITITGVSAGGHGLVLTGAWLIPNVRNSGVGAPLGWPPKQGISAKLWATGRSPNGYKLKPGKVAALIYGVAASSTKGGSTPGPVISYTSGGNRYVYDSTVGTQVVIGHAC
jgi:hypothetical protein